jgi:2-hydroxycyclohexanecarboxyl-CoA dehydrogenase
MARRAKQPTVQLAGGLALVTGAGSGIGRATALALAGRGARVLVADLDAQAAEKVAAECAERGPGAEAHRCDVADADAVAALAERVHATHGPLDVLVNNAGVGMSGPFADSSLEDWRWIRSINLDGVVHGCLAFGPAMVARGRGHVVNLSSGLGYTPRATEPHYVATKAAVLALSQSLRADWRPRGVAVTAICPGIINTPIIDRTRYRGEVHQATRDKTVRMFRRGHAPEAVARAILRAVERDLVMVPVGWEAWLGWGVHRLAPLRAQQLIARQDPI